MAKSSAERIRNISFRRTSNLKIHPDLGDNVQLFLFLFKKRYFKSLGVVPKSPIPRNTSTTASPLKVEVLCRYCSLKLTDSNGLRFQGTTVVCVDQYFDNTVRPPRQVNGTKKTSKTFLTDIFFSFL